MKSLKSKLILLNKVAVNWNNRNLSFDTSRAVNTSDNLTIYRQTKRELELMIEGYNAGDNIPLELVKDKVIYESNDKNYIINVYTYKLVEHIPASQGESLYSLYINRQALQYIDISKLDFGNMTSSMGIMAIPYTGSNENAVLNLLID